MGHVTSIMMEDGACLSSLEVAWPMFLHYGISHAFGGIWNMFVHFGGIMAHACFTLLRMERESLSTRTVSDALVRTLLHL
jgi:hypothetical protein